MSKPLQVIVVRSNYWFSLLKPFPFYHYPGLSFNRLAFKVSASLMIKLLCPVHAWRITETSIASRP